MEQELSSINQLLERRINLLRELADSLQRAQSALVHSNRRQLTVETERQQGLCTELRRQAPELSSEIASITSAASEGSHVMGAVHFARARQRELSAELAAVEAQVGQLNRTYGAFLRRARRTIDIFCRVLANSAATYVPPARPAAASRG
jgi:septal ring factor EnvC (AmiA/AmiB activator)